MGREGRSPHQDAGLGNVTTNSSWADKLANDLTVLLRPALGAGLIAAALFWGQDGWFGFDEWDFVARRRFTDLGSWLTPHGSHWMIMQFVVLRGVYLAVHLDWWPAYPLVTGVAAALSFIGLSWALQMRGMTPVWSAIFGFALGARYILLQPAHLGRPLGVVVVVLLLTIMGTSGPWRRLLVVLVGLIGVALSPAPIVGLLVALAFGISVARMRHEGWWWPPLIPLVVYTAWRLLWGPSRVPTGITEFMDQAPSELVRYSREVIQGFTNIPGSFAALVTIASLALLAWVVVRNRRDITMWMLLATALGLAVLAVLLRTEQSYTRWSTQVVPLVVVAVLPSLRQSGRFIVAVATIILALNPILSGPDRLLVGVREERRASFPLHVQRILDNPDLSGDQLVDSRLYGRLTVDELRGLTLRE